jgi:hypothetical protein
MTDGTPKLVTLRTAKAFASQGIIDPPVSTSERDGFIAETAVKFDQLQAGHRILAREVSELAAKVAEIHETAGQDHRLHAFQQNEQRAKESKLEEVARICRDLKGRLDRIEAHATGDYHAYNSFEAVSRKLGELERPRRTARRWLFRGTLVVVAMLGIGALIPHGQF